jgi:hypothetical protein
MLHQEHRCAGISLGDACWHGLPHRGARRRTASHRAFFVHSAERRRATADPGRSFAEESRNKLELPPLAFPLGFHGVRHLAHVFTDVFSRKLPREQTAIGATLARQDDIS